MVPISGKPEIGGRRPGRGRHPSRRGLRPLLRMTVNKASVAAAMEIGLRVRPPHGRLSRSPDLGPLRLVVMPGTRLEVAELLVEHLVELAEEFDDVVVMVAVIGGNV